MDLLVPDEWLRDFLDTKANASEIAKYLSLCGPSVEKIEKINNSEVYSIEVTTNRSDLMGIYGLAREASAILPRFGIKAKFKELQEDKNFEFTSKVSYISAKVDNKLCPRFSASLIRNVNISDSPEWIKKRLELVGLRPINNIVDISNYIMHELGQPTHTFDYDKIKGQKMFLRASVKGEEIITLDGQKLILPGGDIVIEDGQGRLIDLAGIMGGLNSAVDEKTKNILFFVQTYNPSTIRKTSMRLSKRTEASSIFEKSPDTQLVKIAMLRGISLIQKISGGQPDKKILDIYPHPPKPKSLNISLSFIEERLGEKIHPNEVINILKSLGFGITNPKNFFRINVPSFRSNDINIPEDIVEEVARIYGYQNLPTTPLRGEIPDPLPNPIFDFEKKLKILLKGLGGVEVYTLSLVSKEDVAGNALKIKNPLGEDTQYLRTSLVPSLIKAADQNLGYEDKFHLFEIANVYLPKNKELPEEKIMLASIFKGFSFREVKGITEALLEELRIKAEFEVKETEPILKLNIKSGNADLGEFGILHDKNYIYWEFGVEVLKSLFKPHPTFRPIAKYPAQVEDLTFIIPTRIRIGEIISFIKNQSKLINKCELKDIFDNNFTFRIWYQHPKKTLTDQEVKRVREYILERLKGKYGISSK